MSVNSSGFISMQMNNEPGFKKLPALRNRQEVIYVYAPSGMKVCRSISEAPSKTQIIISLKLKLDLENERITEILVLQMMG